MSGLIWPACGPPAARRIMHKKKLNNAIQIICVLVETVVLYSMIKIRKDIAITLAKLNRWVQTVSATDGVNDKWNHRAKRQVRFHTKRLADLRKQLQAAKLQASADKFVSGINKLLS